MKVLLFMIMVYYGDYGEGTIFINIGLLLNMLKKTSCCPECQQKVFVDVGYNLDKKAGLAHFFEMTCPVCEWRESFCTSHKIQISMFLCIQHTRCVLF